MGGVRESYTLRFGLTAMARLQASHANPTFWGLCCRDHVPEVVRVVSSLSHRLGWVPVLLFPWETELRVYQLLQHPSLQWAEAQEKRQFCLGHEARASHHCPALQLSPLLGTLLKLKEMPTPAASSVRPALSHLPESLLGVLLFWVDKKVFLFPSTNARLPCTNTL